MNRIQVFVYRWCELGSFCRSRFIGDVPRKHINSTTSEFVLSRHAASSENAYTRDCVGAIRPWCMSRTSASEAISLELRSNAVLSEVAVPSRRLHEVQTSEGERWHGQRSCCRGLPLGARQILTLGWCGRRVTSGAHLESRTFLVSRGHHRPRGHVL